MSYVLCKYCCRLRCSTVLVSQRGNTEGFGEAKGDPPREVVERRKAVPIARQRDRRDIETRRQAEIAAAAGAGARNKLSPEGKKIEAKKSIKRTLLSRRNTLSLIVHRPLNRNS